MIVRMSIEDEDTKLPTRKNNRDAGLDLYAKLRGEYRELYPGEVFVFHTGVYVEIPRGYFGWITNKSRSNYIIGGGIVDEGYQGELLVKVINVTDEEILIRNGEAIAQLLFIPILIPGIEFVELKELYKEKTERGDSGGISTLNLQVYSDGTLYHPDKDIEELKYNNIIIY